MWYLVWKMFFFGCSVLFILMCVLSVYRVMSDLFITAYIILLLLLVLINLGILLLLILFSVIIFLLLYMIIIRLFGYWEAMCSEFKYLKRLMFLFFEGWDFILGLQLGFLFLFLGSSVFFFVSVSLF